MSKKNRVLDILIPQYHETDEKLEKMLNSLLVQETIGFTWDDVGVIICNDGSDVHLSDELLNRYPFKIEYHLEPHRGVSGTRNACLDYSNAEYVMFCDADDLFCDVCGLYLIFYRIHCMSKALNCSDKYEYYTLDSQNKKWIKCKKTPSLTMLKKKPYFVKGFDILVSCFREEYRSKETNFFPTYVKVGLVTTVTDASGKQHRQGSMDNTFVHGKVYRRKYLVDNDIRWNEELTIHEDSYFNILAIHCTPYLKYIDKPFYLWKWYDESVCRHDPKYMIKTFNKMLDSNSAVVREFIRRDRLDAATMSSTAMIIDCYMTLNKDEWINQENQEYRQDVERRFREYFKEFKDLFYKLYRSDKDSDKKVLNQLYATEKNKYMQQGMFMEEITFKDWIKQVEESIEQE